MKLLKNKKKGFTLVEILLVVGFIALAGIGIYTVYSKVQMSNAALTESKNLDTMRSGVKNLFGGSQNYVGVTNSVLNDARITPDSMRAIPYQQGDATITNSFGGAVSVGTANLESGTNNGFYIQYDSVPNGVCSKLVGSAGNSWDGVIVGSTVVKEFGTGNLKVADMTGACGVNSKSGITIKFYSL